MAAVGANPKLGLCGHPDVRMEAMATARLYRCGDARLAFLAAVLEESTFYLSDDPEQLVDAVGAELRLLQRHWHHSHSSSVAPTPRTADWNTGGNSATVALTSTCCNLERCNSFFKFVYRTAKLSCCCCRFKILFSKLLYNLCIILWFCC